MLERELILKKREAQIAETSESKDRIDQLKSEVRKIESRIDNLQKLRTDLVSRQIETQAFVGNSDAYQTHCNEQLGNQLQNIKTDIEEITRKADLADVQAKQIQNELDIMADSQLILAQEKEMYLMKKHAFDELVSEPAKRKKFYQDEINKLKLDKNLTIKEKKDAEKNA